MNRGKIIKITANPLFIAAIIMTITLPFLLKQFPRYTARITYDGVLPKPDGCLIWADVLNNSESQSISWFNNTEGKATLRFAGANDFVWHQQGFDGRTFPLRNPPFCYDRDRDNYPEIYVFYHRNDSLFFSCIEFRSDSGNHVAPEVYVDIVANSNGDKDYSVSCTKQGDLDGDFKQEFIFTISAGYPVYPRNLYSYNFRSHKMSRSDFLGAHSGVQYIEDINDDGRKEIILGQYAPGNMKSTTDSIHDRCVRYLVLDNRFDTLFTPPVFSGEHSSIQSLPVRYRDLCYLVLVVEQQLKNEKIRWLLLYNPEGKQMAKRKLSGAEVSDPQYLIGLSGSKYPVHLISTNGNVTGYNLDLVPVHKKNHHFRTSFPLEYDIDSDGKTEFLCYWAENSQLTLARHDLKRPVSVKLPQGPVLMNLFSLKKNKGKPDELSFQYGNRYCLVSYSSNPYYPFRFIGLILSFGVIAGFVSLVQYFQRLVFRDRYLTERKVSELQLLLMRNQITPHFLFNAINTISYRLVEKNPEEANNSIIRLSRLIRNTLVSTDSFSRSLQEELDTTTAWVDIVRSQAEYPFTFRSEILPEVNMATQVPVMVIQGYVENAFKHGIRSLGREGLIVLTISQDKKYLHILITDNGIGRQRSAETIEKPDSTGKGMQLMGQFFTELNKYNENKINFTITDLEKEDGSPAGTEVILDIPVNLKFRIYE